MRTLRLVLDEYPEDAIVLRLAPVPLDTFFDISERWDATVRGGDRSPDAIRSLFRDFGDAGFIVSWTYPEAPDGAGMLRRDYGVAIQIVNSWLKGVGSVPVPLPLTSSDGGRSGSPDSDQQPSPEPS